MKEETPQLKQVVSPEQSRKESEELLALHEQELLDNMNKEVDGVEAIYRDYPSLIEHFIKQVPEEQLQRFWGHGITRGRNVDQLSSALNLLENKVMIGDSAQLKSVFQSAWTDGPFLVISEKDKSLVIGGTFEECGKNLVKIGIHRYTGEDIRAIKINIGAFVVDAKFYPLVKDLRKRFPNVNIIYARDLPTYLSK
ncbi:MAG TPA: hypothetical protein VJC06_01955 [Candidatus Paceibacterota bacterium]